MYFWYLNWCYIYTGKYQVMEHQIRTGLSLISAFFCFILKTFLNYSWTSKNKNTHVKRLFDATNSLILNFIVVFYLRNIKCNENEGVNYFEKSLSKVMFDSSCNRNENVERIINGHTKDCTYGTTTNRKKVCTTLVHNLVRMINTKRNIYAQFYNKSCIYKQVLFLHYNLHITWYNFFKF